MYLIPTVVGGDTSTVYLTIPAGYFEAEDRMKFISDWILEKERERLAQIELEKNTKS